MAIQPENARTLDRSVTLLALTVVAAASFGVRVLLVAGIAMSSAMLTEFLCLYIRKIPFRLCHLDAATTGLLLAMMFPATISYFVVSISCIAAIIIGREGFGGHSQRMFLPAAVGYCFAMAAWKTQVLLYPAQETILPLTATLPTTELASASEQWNQLALFPDNWQTWLTGVSNLPMGSSSILLLGIILLVLCLRRASAGFVTIGMVFSSVLLPLLVTGFAHPLETSIATLLTNMTLFSAIYLYGDCAGCPAYAPLGCMGLPYGMVVGIVAFFMQQLGAENAPVILAVCLQPMNEGVHRLIAFCKNVTDQARKERIADETAIDSQ